MKRKKEPISLVKDCDPNVRVTGMFNSGFECPRRLVQVVDEKPIPPSHGDLVGPLSVFPHTEEPVLFE